MSAFRSPTQRCPIAAEPTRLVRSDWRKTLADGHERPFRDAGKLFNLDEHRGVSCRLQYRPARTVFNRATDATSRNSNRRTTTMTNLLIHVPGESIAHSGTFFGGRPYVPSAAEFSWPACRSCKGNMQYLGRIAIPSSGPSTSRHALLFMCQNDPGCCDGYCGSLMEGGNSVHIVAGALTDSAIVPKGGVTLRETEYGTSVVASQLDDYETARQAWAESTGRSPREVLGQLRGSPVWIQ